MNKKSILKSGLLLLVVGSLSACGGGSVSVEEATKYISNASQYDTNNDNKINENEMKAAWAGMTPEEQARFAASFNVSINTINKFLNGDDLTETELEAFKTIVEIEVEIPIEVKIIEEIEVDVWQNFYDNTYDTALNVDGRTNYLAEHFAAIETTHAQGWTGEGINIAVIDSGNHQTHVANVVTDVAPDANIVLYEADPDGDGGWAASHVFGAIIQAAEEGADVINLSGWVHPYETTLSDNQITGWYANQINNIPTAYDAPLVSIIAGNGAADCSSITNCNEWASALLNWQSDLANSTIVVGAINDEGTDLESYSNKAGILKYDYIAAPVIPDNNNGRGTSYAAPVVAGIGALLIDKFDVRGATAKDILLETADDMCHVYYDCNNFGISETFGHGRLNATRALSPIGSLN